MILMRQLPGEEIAQKHSSRMAPPALSKLTTLDLFSGIAGITHALQGIVEPALYCDIDTFSHKVLAKLMQRGLIPKAPVWHDVRTLGKAQLGDKAIDMIVSSWPCVGFSNMGKRQHFEEPGSGLFFQTMRLVDLTKPKAVFFENVPQVMHELDEVRQQLAVKRKYQLRWCIMPAHAVGAPHCRDRWFCLATKPGFKLEVANLKFKAFDWTREPARTTTQLTHAEVDLRCFALGNAVVPACVRKAFFYLVSGGRQTNPAAQSLTYSPLPLVRPLAAAGSGLVRFGFVDAGPAAAASLYAMEPPDIRPKPDLGLVFDPALFAQPTADVSFEQRHPVLQRPVRAAMWNTPRASVTRAARVLTERGLRDLPTQVRFEKATANRDAPLNPGWIEWLMGYPPDWTKAGSHLRP